MPAPSQRPRAGAERGVARKRVRAVVGCAVLRSPGPAVAPSRQPVVLSPRKVRRADRPAQPAAAAVVARVAAAAAEEGDGEAEAAAKRAGCHPVPNASNP